jgi:type II secretory pathway pseudopilin PulG
MKPFGFLCLGSGDARIGALSVPMTGPRRQRGQVVLLSVILVMMIAAAGVTTYAMSGTSQAAKQAADNAKQLATVKTALISYAMNGRNPGPAACAGYPNTNWRPGELPCPDTNNDGVEECTCTATNRIGRVPWKTLGIEDPKDSAGETLWYAISTVFRPWASNANPINSDTRGNLSVWKDDVSNNLTTEAVAVIFAPGAEIGTQSRSSAVTGSTPRCTLTNTVIAPNLCANNYMESTPNGGANWRNTGPFVMSLTTPSTGTFNDQLLPITTADLIPLVEQRVAKDIISLLAQYKTKSVCNCYPWADNNWNGTSNSPNRKGTVPLETALPENWGSGAIPAMTPYLIQNDWWRVMYYAVADRVTQTPSTFMVLNLNAGGGNTSVVLIAPGPATGSRPSNNWADYIDDTSNRDGDDNFFTPTSTAYTKDRLYSIPYP